MTAAFSFGPLGAMTDLVVAAAVAVENERRLTLTTTSRGQRWAQRARRNPRSWTVGRAWQDPAFAKKLSVAAAGLGGDMYLYDRACARQNMIPSAMATGTGAPVPVGFVDSVDRTNWCPNPSFETGTAGWGIRRTTGIAALARSTNSFGTAVGSYCMSVTGASSPTTLTAIIQSDPITVEPGEWVAAAASMRCGLSSRVSACLRVYWLDAAGDELRSQPVVKPFTALKATTNNLSDNRYVSDAVQVPSDAASMRLAVHYRAPDGTSAPPSGFTANIDAVQVSRSATGQAAVAELGVYFDGATMGNGINTYRWVSTPNASPSQEVTGGQDSLHMGAVSWQTAKVFVLAGRTYTISGWTANDKSPLSVSWPGQDASQMLPPPVAGHTSMTITPVTDGFITLFRMQDVSGVRVHEGIPDGRFYATEGTPCRVAVEDPSRVYQLVTDTETRVDYSVTLSEVGATGIY